MENTFCKVAVMTPMWGRPEVFKMFALGIKALEYPIDVVCVGSEGETSKRLAESYGFHYVEHPNDLIQKLNVGSKKLQELNPDISIMLGSDDVINRALLDTYIQAYKDGIEYSYITDAYFYDTISRQCLYWAGYNTEKELHLHNALGAGRVLSRDLMKRLNWQPWADGYGKITDTGMDVRLRQINYISKAFRCQNSNNLLLDIKSETNMTKFTKWPNSEFVTTDAIRNRLPKTLCATILK